MPARMIQMPHWPRPMMPSAPGTPRERTQAICNALGNPEQKLPSVIHVAGTNGKGSTITFMRSLLEAAGYKAHVYTSPHIERFNERIVLAGEMIDDGYLHDVLERARLATGDLPHHFFDATTAAALLAFSEVEADILLVETGMGGLHDPTNVIDQKILTILTPVSYDHMEYLGSSLTDIAMHKTGIWREGIPCVVGPQTAEVNALLRAQAKERKISLISYGLHWSVQIEKECFMLQQSVQQERYDMPSLPGFHQCMNAAVAIVALQQLLPDISMTEAQIHDGLKQVTWPARMEKISEEDGYEIWCDGGHNEGGAQAVAEHIKNTWNDMPVCLIFGTTKGKDVAHILQYFTDTTDAIYAVPAAAEPHCYTPEEIVQQAAKKGINVMPSSSVDEAIHRIMDTHTASRILIFGSLYLRLEC